MGSEVSIVSCCWRGDACVDGFSEIELGDLEEEGRSVWILL